MAFMPQENVLVERDFTISGTILHFCIIFQIPDRCR
jgi:hypothetical protein